MSVISEEKLQELIEGVPDEDDPDIINYWVEVNGQLVYLEGWGDKCLAGTGFPPMEEGETAQKIAYIEDLTPGILQRKAKERRLKLLKGGFRELPDAENLYGVTYGIYEKIKGEGNPMRSQYSPPEPSSVGIPKAKAIIPEVTEKRAPVDIILRKEPEPLYPSGYKYVAYEADGTPRYIAAETVEATEARVRKSFPVRSIRVGEVAIPKAEAGVPKEPWQMTLEEYAYGEARRLGEAKPRIDWVKAGYGQHYRNHKASVKYALLKGKPVPAEVLKDYPDLAKTIPKASQKSGNPLPITAKEPWQMTQIIPDLPTLDVRNLEALPRGTGAPYLLTIRGPGEVLIAKQWKRTLPMSLAPDEVIIAFRTAKEYPELVAKAIPKLELTFENLVRGKLTSEQLALYPLDTLQSLRREMGRAISISPFDETLRATEKRLLSAINKARVTLSTKRGGAIPKAPVIPEVAKLIYTGIPPASKAKMRQIVSELPVELDTGVVTVRINPTVGTVGAISFPGEIQFAGVESITKPIVYHELAHLHVRRMPKAQVEQLFAELNTAMEKVSPVTKERFKSSEDIVMAFEEYVLGKLKPESPVFEVYTRWFPKKAIPEAEPGIFPKISSNPENPNIVEHHMTSWLLLHSVAYISGGSPGIVVDADVAARTPCTAYDSIWFSKGIIGSLSEAQKAAYCPTVERKTSPGLEKRLRDWKEAVGVCKAEIEGIQKGERLEPWLSCMGRELPKRGIEV